jgi:hypothetical protein
MQPLEIAELAAELARRWLSLLAKAEWSQRVSLLLHIHEQMLDDLGDLDTYNQVSAFFIRDLIELLGGGPIASANQAHIYANSGDPAHRRAAAEWLEQHRPAAGAWTATRR